jgi:TldD protein
MNIVIDPTYPGALGSFGWDDEGTRAARRDAVRNGIWTGVLAGRESSAVAGLDYAGSVRAEDWSRLPMVRMTNVGLEPGPHTLEEIIAETSDGIFMDMNRSWSIDDKRLNFQFGCEVGYEVKNGRLGRMLKNPTYTGIGPRFWQSMDMLSSEIVAWGTPNCGKGQPGQVGHTGHPSAPARFRDVRVGVRG